MMVMTLPRRRKKPEPQLGATPPPVPVSQEPVKSNIPNYLIVGGIGLLLGALFFSTKKNMDFVEDFEDGDEPIDNHNLYDIEDEDEDGSPSFQTSGGAELDLPEVPDYVFKKKNPVASIKELKLGVKTEMEHTTDPKEAMKIAMDHLKEDYEYYTKLAQCMPKKKKTLAPSAEV
jgi:hypothetical protein